MLQANLADLQIESGDTESARVAVREIQSAARLTADLLDGLLEYARLENADDRAVNVPVELDSLLLDLLNIHAAAAANKGLRLTTAIDTGVSLTTDRLKLERIVNNLLSNAIKFTAAGSVSLEVECGSDGIEIHVVDTGIGVSPHDQQHLFDEFFQAHNQERDRQKGFGLGLAICRRLSRQIGAELRLASEVGRGSRFTLVVPYLPRADRAAAAVDGEPFATASPLAGAAAGALG